MRTVTTYIFILICIVGNFSCTDFLEVVPDDIATIDDAFSMRSQAEKYLFTLYNYMPPQAAAGQNPAFMAGDEMWVSNYNNTYPLNIARGYQTANDPIVDYWRGAYGGKDLYQGISDCNIFFENIGKVPDMVEKERGQWIAEVKFLKAYYHYWLVRMYGPIIIKDKNVPVNAPTEDVRAYRNTLDECFEYIVNLLDEVIASPDMPNKVSNEATELGRIDKTIAKAIKADVLLTAASPLFNGNGDFKAIKDNRDIAIFSTDKSEDEKKARWQAAADACKEAIDAAHEQGYKLFRYTSTQYPVSAQTRLKLTIRGIVTEPWNSEVIWGNTNQASAAQNLQLQSFPRGMVANFPMPYCGNYGIPIKVTEVFYTRNGVPITEDRTWDYTKRYELQEATENEKYYIKTGYITAKLNFGREPRYYASLGFDGAIYYGFGNTAEMTLTGGDNPNYSPYYVQSKAEQASSNQANTSFNPTGYWPKKLLNFRTMVNATSAGWVPAANYEWPVIRLGQLYLSYAEALNEIDNREEAIQWTDSIRRRAGLKGIKESWDNYSANPTKYTSYTGLQEIIQQERLIELAFEGQRFWDIRRWKRAIVEWNKPITGWSLTNKDAEHYYAESLLFDQKFKLRDYFWPIYYNEILANPNMVQNYGW